MNQYQLRIPMLLCLIFPLAHGWAAPPKPAAPPTAQTVEIHPGKSLTINGWLGEEDTFVASFDLRAIVGEVKAVRLLRSDLIRAEPPARISRRQIVITEPKALQTTAFEE